MAHNAEISRVNPTVFPLPCGPIGFEAVAIRPRPLFGGKTKAQGVADAYQSPLSDLGVALCQGCVHPRPLLPWSHRIRWRPLFGRPCPRGSVIGKSPLRVEERVKKVENAKHQTGRGASHKRSDMVRAEC